MKKFILLPLIIVLLGGFLFCLNQSAIAAQKSKSGGILRMNTAKSVANFGDPVTARGAYAIFATYCLEGLVQLSNEKMGTYEPLLASSWDLAPDKSHLIFHLRKGVKFHDGTEFNAEATKWNTDRWIEAKRSQVDSIRSIDVIDHHTIRVNLKLWDRTVLNAFAQNVAMISPTAFQKNGQKWSALNPVGTGPFKVEDFKRDIHIKFVRNPDYWNKGLPYLDGIFYTMVPDPMTAKAMIIKGELDLWTYAEPISAEELKKTGEFVVTPGLGPHSVFSFNSKDPTSPWSDKRMRMAFEYAINKEAIWNAVGRGFRQPLYEVVGGIPPTPGIEKRKYNPEKARQLVKEAGYEGITVELLFFGVPEYRTFVSPVQRYLSEIGINMTLKPLTLGPMFQYIFGKKLKAGDICLGPLFGSPGTLFADAKRSWHSDSLLYQMSPKPEGYMALLNQAMTAETIDQGIKYLQQMDRLLRDDVVIVPFGIYNPATVARPYVKDFYDIHGGSTLPKAQWAWLDK